MESVTEALDTLKAYRSDDIIGAIYDLPGVAEAISTLLPDFEYPDIDCLTVQELIRKHRWEKKAKVHFASTLGQVACRRSFTQQSQDPLQVTCIKCKTTQEYRKHILSVKNEVTSIPVFKDLK